jgi:hypothetical protein
MRRYFSTAALAISLLGGVIAPVLKAGEWDKKTKITINQPIEIQGTLLPAGSYIMRLADSSDRSVVQIFNADENHLIATTLAVHAFEQKRTDGPRFHFYESVIGEQAPSLRFWFYAGGSDGLEFRDRRPQVTAQSTRNDQKLVASVPRVHAEN